MKIGRKRHRNSLGPTAEDDGSVKKVKSSSYPTEFPVGKTVFLENDRRRSSWLPAVVRLEGVWDGEGVEGVWNGEGVVGVWRVGGMGRVW